MKKLLYKTFYLFSGILMMCSSAEAQTEKKDKEAGEDRRTQELILGVPKVSEKNLFLLTSTAEKIKGLKYVDFCEADKLLLVKYDPEIYPRPEEVIKAFHEQNIVMPMLIKPGKFESVKQMCIKQETK